MMPLILKVRKFGTRLGTRITWSNLSGFGNSPIVRLVALAPIVAAVIKVQDVFFEETLYLKEAEWLYWSLIAIAVGQLLYFVFCPRVIKKYGADIERHTIEGLSSLPQQKIADLLAERLRQLYSRGGLLLGADPQDPQIRQQLVEAMRRRDVGLSPMVVDRYLEAFSSFYRVVENAEFDAIGSINFKALDEMASVAPEFFAHEGAEGKAYVELRHVIGERAYSAEQDWKVGALDWRYNVANVDKGAMISVVAFCYAVGSVYFLYRTLDGLRFMLGHLLGVNEP
jgi:hypothetical protein